MKELVAEIAKALVDYPDVIQVTAVEGSENNRIGITRQSGRLRQDNRSARTHLKQFESCWVPEA